MNKYLSLIKFSHTVFALPFAMIGFTLGYQTCGFSLSKLGLVLLCMVCARSAAMAFNRYIDRDIDAANPRTAVREIPSGVVSASNALRFTVACSVGLVAATYFINPLCFYLSPVALLLTLGYSLTKRFTALCHIVLGLSLSLAPIGAYMAVTGNGDNWIPWAFSVVVVLWVSGFDVIYALQDEDFDKSKGLNSIPVWLGTSGALRLSTALHVVCAVVLASIMYFGGFHILANIGAAIFIGLLAYQHSLVKPTDLSRINLAFFTTNGIASIAFGACMISDMVFL